MVFCCSFCPVFRGNSGRRMAGKLLLGPWNLLAARGLLLASFGDEAAEACAGLEHGQHLCLECVPADKREEIPVKAGKKVTAGSSLVGRRCVEVGEGKLCFGTIARGGGAAGHYTLTLDGAPDGAGGKVVTEEQALNACALHDAFEDGWKEREAKMNAARAARARRAAHKESGSGEEGSDHRTATIDEPNVTSRAVTRLMWADTCPVWWDLMPTAY